MSRSSAETVAVLGGGPAGCTVAALLARAGRTVALFHTETRPELIVGESQVPAVVPILRRLGVEAEVAATSVLKPGATVTFSATDRYPLPFADSAGSLPDYSYQTPRGVFDEILLDAARRHGAHLFPKTARLQRRGATRVALDDASLDATDGLFGARGPDLIVDATGRARLIARQLALPTVEGTRRDVSLFAHYDRVKLDRPADVHVDRHRLGWGWRIPLPGKVSLGVVIDPRHLGPGSRAAQLDALVATDPVLRALEPGERVSEVKRYDNYQLYTTQLVGPGWALVGDAAGFADPIFSTGTYLALRGAEMLADALLSERRDGLDAYRERWLGELRAWQRIVGLWYDGRLFSLLRTRRRMRRFGPGRLMDRHIGQHMTRIFTGEAGSRGYSQTLLTSLAPMGHLGAKALAIR